MRLLIALLVSSVGVAARSEPPPTQAQAAVAQPSLRGHIVREGDRSPVEGATVDPQGFGAGGLAVVTHASGSYEVPGSARCGQSNATANRGVDYLRVSAAGYGVALVDPRATAPWADPVRLRPGATLSGRIEGLAEGRAIDVIAPASELCWPPRSGLTCSDVRWSGLINAEGRFEITGLPAQVPLSLRHTVGERGDGYELVVGIVLLPGERRELPQIHAAEADAKPVRTESTDRAEAPWIPVEALAFDDNGQRSLAWFEFVRGGRFARHRVGGGRWHVHQHRACEHLEITPGPSMLVARDAAGWIGVEAVEIGATTKAAVPRITLAPGALQRIDATGLPARARVLLSSAGIDFVDVDLLPGVVRYEVVPAGAVRIRIEVDGFDAQTREVTTTPGANVDLKL